MFLLIEIHCIAEKVKGLRSQSFIIVLIVLINSLLLNLKLLKIVHHFSVNFPANLK